MEHCLAQDPKAIREIPPVGSGCQSSSALAVVAAREATTSKTLVNASAMADADLRNDIRFAPALPAGRD